MRILILAPLLFTIMLAASSKSPTMLSNGDGASRVLLEGSTSVLRESDAVFIYEQIHGYVYNGSTPITCDSMKLSGLRMTLDTSKQIGYVLWGGLHRGTARDSLVPWIIYSTSAPEIHAVVQIGAHAGVWIYDDTISIEKGIAATASNQLKVVGDSIYLSFRSQVPERPGRPAYFSFLDSEPIVLTPAQLRLLTVGASYQLSIGRIRTKIESKDGVVIETRFRYEDVKSVTIVK